MSLSLSHAPPFLDLCSKFSFEHKYEYTIARRPLICQWLVVLHDVSVEVARQLC